MSTTSIRVNLSIKCYKDFVQLLKENEIEASSVDRKAPPRAIMNAGPVIEILNALQIPSIAASVATVICTFLKAKASRKIIITTNDNQIIHAEGYSKSEIQELLKDVKLISVVDTE